MLNDEELFASAETQQERMTARDYSSVELTRAHLQRIEALNGELRAYVAVDADAAVAQAEQADKRRRSGDCSPLLGVPIGLKDIIDTADLPTTYGSRVFEGRRPALDAMVTRRLRAVGAVILGKTNTFEFAFNGPSPLFRDARNPWKARHVAGGSSNGSAVAAAAALGTLSIGTDTAGSIRNPASYCGVVGLKPTHGRVSTRGVGELAGSMDTVGPMTRSVADAATVLAAIAGHDRDDRHSGEQPTQDYFSALKAGARDVVLGVPRAFFENWLSNAVDANWRSVLAELEAAGAQLRDVDLPDLTGCLELWLSIAAPEASCWHAKTFPMRRDDYGPAALAGLTQMQGSLGVDYIRALDRRHALRRALVDAMRDVDVLVVPSTPTTAFTFEEAKAGKVSSRTDLSIADATTGLTIPFSVTGQPALAVPTGLTGEGLPLSVQVVGRPFAEARVLRVGYAIEQLVRFSYRPPLPPAVTSAA